VRIQRSNPNHEQRSAAREPAANLPAENRTDSREDYDC
jgi:hypothetical protein